MNQKVCLKLEIPKEVYTLQEQMYAILIEGKGELLFFKSFLFLLFKKS